MGLNLPKTIADQRLRQNNHNHNHSDMLSLLPACKLSGVLQGTCQAHGLLWKGSLFYGHAKDMVSYERAIFVLGTDYFKLIGQGDTQLRKLLIHRGRNS